MVDHAKRVPVLDVPRAIVTATKAGEEMYRERGRLLLPTRSSAP